MFFRDAEDLLLVSQIFQEVITLLDAVIVRHRGNGKVIVPIAVKEPLGPAVCLDRQASHVIQLFSPRVHCF